MTDKTKQTQHSCMHFYRAKEDSSYAGYHLSYEVKKLMYASHFPISNSLFLSCLSLFLFIFQFRFSYIGWMFSSRFVSCFYIAVYDIQPPHYRFVHILIILLNFPNRANQVCPIFRYVDHSKSLIFIIFF